MKILLIPSAILVPKEMRKSLGDIPTALFPVNNTTMLEHIYNRYKKIVDVIYIIVDENYDLIQNYISVKKIPIQIVKINSTHSLGHTIKYGLNHILNQHSNIDYLYINFGDSLIDEDIYVGNKNFFYFSNIKSDEDWTYVKYKSNVINDIKDKSGTTINGTLFTPEDNNIFIGLFGINDPYNFNHLINIDTNTQKNIDPFYIALYKYNLAHDLYAIKTQTWLDTGHISNYLNAKTKVAAREFNTIKIDEKRGILKKYSINKDKLINEISWYLKLPAQLQYLSPRIYNYSLNSETPYVSMEYYGYHTLHELLIYGNVTLLKWHNIFQKLLFVLNDMENYQTHKSIEDMKSSLEKIYQEKTFSRLNHLRNNPSFSIFFEKPIYINDVKFLSLNEYIPLLRNLIDQLLINSFNGTFNIIHGDLCFSNIFIEDTYNFIRLIDPRGNFGKFDIYGDSRYEIAKLLHTLEGKYDYIIEDMFSIQVHSNRITFTISDYSKDVLKIFKHVFSQKLYNIRELRLIEATLFLSMIPLHSDFPDRQMAMLATGIQILDSIVKGD